MLRAPTQSVAVSDFAAAEPASAIARRVRTKELSVSEARDAFAGFDIWMTRNVHRMEALTADVAQAAGLIRRLDLPLRTPDALHLAIAQRSGATLATFDHQMAAAATMVGLAAEAL